MIVSIFFIIVGFALLILGADWLVNGASSIAKKFHIPEIIIGLTIVSIGTSMPELFVSTTSALEGLSDMSIGNVVGSNLCNLLLILGLSTIIKPVKFQKETRLFEIPMCLIFTVIFIILCNTGGTINKVEAVLLLLLFLLFITYTIFMAKKQNSQEKQQEVKTQKKLLPILKDILWIILGVIGLKVGGDLAVNNAVNIANYFGVSEKIIGLTILAVGTSLPELVTSVTAAIKGNSDIAIGNIIGSNIFNMLLIIGVVAFINPISYNFSYNMDLIVLVVATLILALFPVIPPKNEMSRANGIIYFLMYVGYIGYLLVN
ncbi:MAG: calcium/sodium antiporter [Clostridia bacterium]|nr:calcium/sodium antiporter [Clostridia bacterium]